MVTGGAAGIGRAYCEELLKNGAKVRRQYLHYVIIDFDSIRRYRTMYKKKKKNYNTLVFSSSSPAIEISLSIYIVSVHLCRTRRQQLSRRLLLSIRARTSLLRVVSGFGSCPTERVLFYSFSSLIFKQLTIPYTLDSLSSRVFS